MNEEEKKIFERIESLRQLSPDDILKFRRWAEHNLEKYESESKTKKHRMQHGFPIDSYWNMTERNLTFAKLYLNKIKEEIEKIQMEPKKNIVNYGIIQEGNHNTASQDFSIKKDLSSTSVNIQKQSPETKKQRMARIMWKVIGAIIGVAGIFATVWVAYHHS